MRVLYDDPATLDFIGRHGGGAGFGDCRSIGFLDAEGVLRAGFAYHNWNADAETIEISAASVGKWVTRERVLLAFGYPFDFCQLVYVSTRLDNREVRRCMAALHGTEYEIPRLRGRDTPGLIITLTAEAWGAWKGHRHGR